MGKTASAGESDCLYSGMQNWTFADSARQKLHKLGAKVYCNPDGLEWKRSKWSAPAKAFLRYCEKCLVENSDLAICDSVNIEKYIKDTYGSRVKDTTFIAYGAYTDRSQCDEEKLNEWYTQFNVNRGDYYLIVGRFVPENNYETMITEFMRSKTEKDLVIITNVEHNKFYEQLREKTGFEKDKRIKFVGTVYDQDLLKKSVKKLTVICTVTKSVALIPVCWRHLPVPG